MARARQVVGMTELLNHSRMSEEQQAWLTTIRQSSQALLSRLTEILHFAKVTLSYMILFFGFVGTTLSMTFSVVPRWTPARWFWRNARWTCRFCYVRYPLFFFFRCCSSRRFCDALRVVFLRR